MGKEKSKNEYITCTDLTEQFEEHTQVLLTALDKRLNGMEDRLRTDINNVQTLIDGYVKAQEDFKQEFVIMKEELIQIKKIIKEKLGLEIKAV